VGPPVEGDEERDAVAVAGSMRGKISGVADASASSSFASTTTSGASYSGRRISSITSLKP
jgi:hypothetical protein